MKFKLDENFGTRTSHLFKAEGHDVQTVHQQGISGCSDRVLFDICRDEGRCLITMDLDFSDVTRFPPALSSGIAVFRFPKGSTLPMVEQLVRQYLKALAHIPCREHLCIVEPGRIRLHQPADDDSL